MSVNLKMRYELERRRKEELRLENVRQRAQRLIEACEAELVKVREPAVQQLVTEDLQRIRRDVAPIGLRIAGMPDEALEKAEALHKRLHQAVAAAEAKARKWRRERAAARARIAEAASRATAADGSGQPGGGLQAEISQARQLEEAGHYKQAEAACAQIEHKLQSAAQAHFDDTVRREVVRGLLDTLQRQGFVVEGPQLRAAEQNGGVVTLLGRLPSGRAARFEVHLDGRMEFDLNGYEGRACAKDVEQIEKSLQERFGVQLSPPQVTWKNPDKISRGARDLPTGGTRALR